MRRATYAWFNRWFDMKDADDDETSQAVETGRDAVRDADRLRDDVVRRRNGALADAADGRLRSTRRRRSARTTCARAFAACSASRRRAARRWRPASSPPSGSRDTGPNSSSSRASARFARRAGCSRRTTPDPSTPTVLYVGEAAAWSSVAEDAFAERCARRADAASRSIDVRGRGDCAIAYPRRGRFYFPNRIPNEAYLTWFTLMLGKPLLGGQVYDTLRALRLSPVAAGRRRRRVARWATDRTA